MTEPVAYVSTWRIAPERFAEFMRFHDQLVKIVDENGPRISAFLAFANEEGTEITTVHVFPDDATLDRHMTVLGEKVGALPNDIRGVMGELQSRGIQVLGRPGGRAAAMDRGMADGGVPFTFKPRFLGGFTRQP